MRKKRILWPNEASFLNTGYSTYGREVMSRMHASGKYEIAELACYAEADDARSTNFPWKTYRNYPANDQEKKIYDESWLNHFGKWQFEKVCLDFQPDYVLDIRDFWMWSFQSTSPFRKFYRHIIMPTVDSEPQQPEWLWRISQADAVLTYQDWSLKYLSKFNGMDNLVKSAPSAANPVFVPEDKKQARRLVGLPEDIKIVGTLMRNQLRKLYPELFRDFKRFLEKTQRDDVFLLCHTSYPDLNCWDIPSLLNEYGLSSKVFFSYRCANCGNLKVCKYQDVFSICERCGADTMCFPSVHNGVPTEALAKIYNVMDLYVQYACAEGLGMPQLEAAACGIPVMSTNYSGMEDVIEKLDGYPINYVLAKEKATDCFRAIPNSGDFINKLISFFQLTEQQRQEKSEKIRKNFEKHYHSWDNIANIWMDVIDKTPMPELKWNHPARFKNIPNPPQEQLTDTQYARWLIKSVLQIPEEINGFVELDLIERLQFKHIDRTGYNREQVFNIISGQTNFWNEWEQVRTQMVQKNEQ